MTRAGRRSRSNSMSSTGSNAQGLVSISDKMLDMPVVLPTSEFNSSNITNVSCTSSTCSSVATDGNATTFPRKLAEMLQHESHVIAWSMHGLSFFICDNEALTYRLLPKYFRHNKLTSFQRQLNLYGFRRITKGTDTGAYFHPQFRRDRPELVNHIRRMPGQGATATAKFLPLYYKDVQNSSPTSMPDMSLAEKSAFMDVSETNAGISVKKANRRSRKGGRAPRRPRDRSESSASNVSQASLTSSAGSECSFYSASTGISNQDGSDCVDGSAFGAGGLSCGAGEYASEGSMSSFPAGPRHYQYNALPGGAENLESGSENLESGSESAIEGFDFADPAPSLTLTSSYESGLSLLSDEGSYMSSSSATSKGAVEHAFLPHNHQPLVRLPNAFAASTSSGRQGKGYVLNGQKLTSRSPSPSAQHQVARAEVGLPPRHSSGGVQSVGPVRFFMPPLSDPVGADALKMSKSCSARAAGNKMIEGDEDIKVTATLYHGSINAANVTNNTGESDKNKVPSGVALPRTFSASSFSQWLNSGSDSQTTAQTSPHPAVLLPVQMDFRPLPSCGTNLGSETVGSDLVGATDLSSPSTTTSSVSMSPTSRAPSSPPLPLLKINRCSSMSSELWRGWGSTEDLEALADLDTSIDDIFGSAGPESDMTVQSAGGWDWSQGQNAEPARPQSYSTSGPSQAAATGVSALGALVGITAS